MQQREQRSRRLAQQRVHDFCHTENLFFAHESPERELPGKWNLRCESDLLSVPAVMAVYKFVPKLKHDRRNHRYQPAQKSNCGQSQPSENNIGHYEQQ